MKRKFILALLISTSIFIIGCNKVEENVDKEVIVIDETAKETVENNKGLSLNLKFRGYLDISDEMKKLSEEIKKISEIEDITKREPENIESEIYYFLEDSVFRITVVALVTYAKDGMAQSGSLNIVKIEMKKVKLNSRDEDLKSGDWTELDIDGILLGSTGYSRDVKIFTDNKVYRLLSDGSLKEIEVYSEVYRDYDNEEYISPKINVIKLDNEQDIGIIKFDENKYFEIRNTDKITELYENDFRVFEAEDNKVYVFSKKPNGDKYELVIGYVEENKFYNLFENDKFKIITQDEESLYYEILIKNNNKILFPGIIDGVNGIWNYDLETKKLSLQLELKKGDIIYSMMISPTKDTLLIRNTSKNESNDSLARVNKNLEIEKIIDITEKDKLIDFDKFSEDGKKLYLGYYEEKNKIVYEIYEITN